MNQEVIMTKGILLASAFAAGYIILTATAFWGLYKIGTLEKKPKPKAT